MENSKIDKSTFTKIELQFIELLSDGYSLQDAQGIFTKEPYNLSVEQLLEFYKNPVILQAIIEAANNKLGQAWGTMWQKIKEKAMLGEIQHAKLLIDFVQNKNSIPLSKFKLVFDDTIILPE